MNEEQTKYRITSDGYHFYIQYLYVRYKRILFWKKKVETWHYVPKAYDGFRYYAMEYKLFVSSYYEKDLIRFTKRYPEIQVYLDEYEKEQNKLDEARYKVSAEREEEAKKITYL